MEDGIDPRVLDRVDPTRRDVVRKLLMGSAFVLPAVASFPMDALAQASTIHNGNISSSFLQTNPATKADPQKAVPESEVGRRGVNVGTPGGPGNVLGPAGQANIPLTPVTPPPKPPAPAPLSPPPPRRP